MIDDFFVYLSSKNIEQTLRLWNKTLELKMFLLQNSEFHPTLLCGRKTGTHDTGMERKR